MNKSLLFWATVTNAAFIFVRGIFESMPKDIKIAAEVEATANLVDDDDKSHQWKKYRTVVYTKKEDFDLLYNGKGVHAISDKKGLEWNTTISDISSMVVRVKVCSLLGRKNEYSRLVRAKNKYLTEEEIESTIKEVRDWQRENVLSVWKSWIE